MNIGIALQCTRYRERNGEGDMKHVVLLGDSIFDNGVYVPGEPSVIEQLRAEKPHPWDEVTLLAVDGHVTVDVHDQLKGMPEKASDCVVSVGGNDALGHAHLISDVEDAGELASVLDNVVPAFRKNYAAMLDAVLEYKLNTTVCTIYDKCPFPEPKWRELVPVALKSFNDAILAEAETRSVPVIELRELCTEPEHYSSLSPIEPSAIGGMKIVQAIIEQQSRVDKYGFGARFRGSSTESLIETLKAQKKVKAWVSARAEFLYSLKQELVRRGVEESDF